MSDANVTPEQKEVPGKDKDEKKVKKKKSVKSSEGKPKSSSRKSSAITPVENGDQDQAETVAESLDQSAIPPEERPEPIAKIEGEDPPEEKSEPMAKTEGEIPAAETDAEASGKKDVVMLREMDFRVLAELKEAFHLFDIDRDGYIDKEDLKFTFTSLGDPNVTEEALEQMLSEMSNDGVDFDTFVKLFGYKVVELDPEEELLAALSKWDHQGIGLISEEILKRDLQGWGDKFSPKEAERALEGAPLYKKDGAMMIDYVKFCNNICGLRNVEKTREIEKEADEYDRELRSLVK